MKIFFTFILLIASQALFASDIGHIEYVVGSQLKYNNRLAGGASGSAFLYIKGLCKDYRFKFPRVIPCSKVLPDLMEKYPHTGVGISLNPEFKNVSWVATPTKELTFSAGVSKGIIQKSLDYRVFEGVQLHKDKASLNSKTFSSLLVDFEVPHKVKNGKVRLDQIAFKELEHANEVFTALHGLGTNVSVSSARDLVSINLELTSQSQLLDLTGYLNRTNGQYRSKQKKFVWHMLMSNSTHLSLNAIHAAGFETPSYRNEPFMRNIKTSEYMKDILDDVKGAINHIQTPIDGFLELSSKFPKAIRIYRAASPNPSEIFNTKKLKAFSFKPLKCSHNYSNELHKLATSQSKWSMRNVLYNNIFYNKYSQHFFDIKKLIGLP